MLRPWGCSKGKIRSPECHVLLPTACGLKRCAACLELTIRGDWVGWVSKGKVKDNL